MSIYYIFKTPECRLLFEKEIVKTTLNTISELEEKQRDFAVRFNADMPSLLKDAIVQDTLGRDCHFSLL